MPLRGGWVVDMIHEIYLKELSKALGYLPAWFPNSKLELGDFLDRNTLERKGNIGSLRDEAICFTVRPASARGSFEYSSARGVSITTKIAGQVVVGSSLGKVDAGLIVKFSKENVIVFEASGCTSIAIDDINSLGSAIMALYNAGHWRRGLQRRMFGMSFSSSLQKTDSRRFIGPVELNGIY